MAKLTMTKTLLARLELILGAPPPPVFSKPMPLALGAFEEIMARYPDADREALAAWLKLWTGQETYLKRLSSGRHRYDLDGNPIDGGIRDQDRNYARILLSHAVWQRVARRQHGFVR
jgi:sRNA-binding protein